MVEALADATEEVEVAEVKLTDEVEVASVAAGLEESDDRVETAS